MEFSTSIVKKFDTKKLPPRILKKEKKNLYIAKNITNYLLTESKVTTGKSETKTLPYWSSNGKVNMARKRFEISHDWRPNVPG